MGIKTFCDAGCGQQFVITDMPTVKLDSGVEKTYFTCPHCQHEYVAFYTDTEIRKLQKRLRRIHRRFTDTKDNHGDTSRKEAVMKALIKEKMDALRRRFDHEGIQD
jgi:uncharacterized Zn finger protein (UPF0148 family)